MRDVNFGTGEGGIINTLLLARLENPGADGEGIVAVGGHYKVGDDWDSFTMVLTNGEVNRWMATGALAAVATADFAANPGNVLRFTTPYVQLPDSIKPLGLYGVKFAEAVSCMHMRQQFASALVAGAAYAGIAPARLTLQQKEHFARTTGRDA